MKTNLDSAYKNAENLEKEGVWFVVGKAKFLVKRFGGSNSEPVKRALATFHKPYARMIAKDMVSDDDLRAITAKTFVHACLLDWSGVEINGKEEPFEKELAIKFFLALPDLLEDVFAYAQDGSNYREELGNF